MEPTKEQIQWFWEQCGFTEEYESDTNAWWIKAPDGKGGIDYPPTDLNNLFKYAVPRLKPKGLILESYLETDEVWYSACILSEIHSGGVWSANSKDPALALFWAIYKTLMLRWVSG